MSVDNVLKALLQIAIRLKEHQNPKEEVQVETESIEGGIEINMDPKVEELNVTLLEDTEESVENKIAHIKEKLDVDISNLELEKEATKNVIEAVAILSKQGWLSAAVDLEKAIMFIQGEGESQKQGLLTELRTSDLEAFKNSYLTPTQELEFNENENKPVAVKKILGKLKKIATKIKKLREEDSFDLAKFYYNLHKSNQELSGVSVRYISEEEEEKEDVKKEIIYLADLEMSDRNIVSGIIDQLKQEAFSEEDALKKLRLIINHVNKSPKAEQGSVLKFTSRVGGVNAVEKYEKNLKVLRALKAIAKSLSKEKNRQNLDTELLGSRLFFEGGDENGEETDLQKVEMLFLLKKGTLANLNLSEEQEKSLVQIIQQTFNGFNENSEGNEVQQGDPIAITNTQTAVLDFVRSVVFISRLNNETLEEELKRLAKSGPTGLEGLVQERISGDNEATEEQSSALVKFLISQPEATEEIKAIQSIDEAKNTINNVENNDTLDVSQHRIETSNQVGAVLAPALQVLNTSLPDESGEKRSIFTISKNIVHYAGKIKGVFSFLGKKEKNTDDGIKHNELAEDSNTMQAKKGRLNIKLSLPKNTEENRTTGYKGTFLLVALGVVAAIVLIGLLANPVGIGIVPAIALAGFFGVFAGVLVSGIAHNHNSLLSKKLNMFAFSKSIRGGLQWGITAMLKKMSMEKENADLWGTRISDGLYTAIKVTLAVVAIVAFVQLCVALGGTPLLLFAPKVALFALGCTGFAGGLTAMSCLSDLHTMLRGKKGIDISVSSRRMERSVKFKMRKNLDKNIYKALGGELYEYNNNELGDLVTKKVAKEIKKGRTLVLRNEPITREEIEAAKARRDTRTTTAPSVAP